MTTPEKPQLKLSDFDFTLPEELIAQEPCSVRDQARLMVLGRKTGGVEHRLFADIQSLLRPGDVLVLNNTKVFPCRLLARKPGGGKAELFLVAELGINRWQALVKGGGKRLVLESGIEAEVLGEGEAFTKTVLFHGARDIKELLPRIGRTPLPPYIKREATPLDLERYQTVYAAHEGAVAAPTAGLHFTQELLGRLEAQGVEIAAVTLHVGPGTFQPVRTELVADHRMLPERWELAEEAARRINRAKAEGRRVIAVGTTSVRTIESAAAGQRELAPGSGASTLFIYPGYQFAMTDGIITNFHLPKSTLIMLVSAFAGRERTLAAYRAAVDGRYRFYSYGDAMAIL